MSEDLAKQIENAIEEKQNAPQEVPKEESVEVAPEENSEREYTDLEKEAMEKGWKPDGEKSAEVWMGNYSFIKELKKSHSEIQDLKNSLKEMKQFHEKELKRADEKHRKELEQARYEAISLGDHEEVDRIDGELRQQAPQSADNSPEEDEAFVGFKDKHGTWLTGDSPEELRMQEYVRLKANALDMSQPNASVQEKLKAVEDALYTHFPDYFEKKSKPAPVLPAKKAPPAKRAFDESMLNTAEAQNLAYLRGTDPALAEKTLNIIKNRLVKEGKIDA